MTDNEKNIYALDENDSKFGFAEPDKQEARAFLRERFLRVVTGIVGRQADFHLYENTNLKAEFKSIDVDGLELYVRNLQTPIGNIPEATLRTSDIIYFNVKGLSYPKTIKI